MNILQEFRQIAEIRLGEHAKEVEITNLEARERSGVVSFRIYAYLDDKLCWGKADTIGKAIDRAIKCLELYKNGELVEPKAE